mmetsp:Transcript_8030/g.8874  ORF Transcript_8030/g.8874 Transcript_8030/m.8874 type:complete len:185 (+) Transcript_8030:3-557(+)
MADTGLLLIDIQNDYFPGGKMELHEMKKAAANAEKALKKFRALKKPVFHVKHIAASPALGFFIEDTEGSKINTTVKPEGSEKVIVKKEINSFKGTNLKAELDAANIKNLVVVGAMSHMCVDGTVRAASDLGYKVQLLQDACATCNLEHGGKKVPAEDVQATMMAALGFAYAEVSNTDDALAKLK